MSKQYAVTYLHYVWKLTDNLDEANAFAKEMKTDAELLKDASQRDLIGPVSDYISVSDVTGQDI